ncbi:hypothetical protein FRX31_014214 [Thalictrum thalictroides]|uniref:Uncharacterized protein n=1 Tax=Thalictrum thalictroides TaxID=46969 RepID=A0A7J6WFK4_THATH|nr:hypothetical protein FRX31_014214 [Thalictrum thalictroides]
MASCLFQTLTSARTTSTPMSSLVMSIQHHWGAPLPAPLCLESIPQQRFITSGCLFADSSCVTPWCAR